MAVRKATEQDLPALIELAQREHKELVADPGHPFGTFDVKTTRITLLAYINHPLSEVFVSADEVRVDGYIVCLPTQAPFNYGYKFGMDGGFYSIGAGAGRALIAAAEEWAKGQRLAAFVVKRYYGARDRATDVFYRRAGYAPMEVWHIKDLSEG